MVKIPGIFGSEGDSRPEAEAQKKMREGHFVAAGKLFETANNLARAAEAYLQGKEYLLAAELFDRMGKREQAAENYVRGGDHKKAADVLARAGQAGKAAELLMQRGQSLEAAKFYGQANQWDKAADLYLKGGYPLRAAQAYEKSGDLARAAECYERHFVENVSYGASQGGAASADHKAALQAGQLYTRIGALDRALQILARAGFHGEAADAASALGEHKKAGEHYERAEALDKAADAWDRAGDQIKAALLRGEVAFKDDRMAEAAAFFQEGQDFYRAAELFESLGLLTEAAVAYEGGGSFAEAGSVYLRAGEKTRAAEAYEKAGQFEVAAKLFEELGDGARSAELFERAGLTFKSGEVAARAGETQKAIAFLQRVDPMDENYVAATELLARLFLEVDMPALASERLQQSLAGQPMSLANVSLFYWLALASEAIGDPAAALGIYKKILSLDFAFRDVAQRVQHLQAPAAASVASPQRAPSPAVSEPAPAIAVPATGPRFVTKEQVGAGPLGVVYRAEDQTDGRSLALRVLPEAALKPDVLGALVAEMIAAARLSHPNLVKVLGVVDLDGQSCVLAEFVRGSNLQESFRSGQRMSVHQCHSLGRTLAQLLSFIHARGLVHGSIRPSNIMILAGVMKLADLGLGRLYHAASPPDAYRAPENRLDVAGDIFALGAVLYQALTGVEPKARTGSPMSRPSQLAPGVPERFDRFLLRCLDPTPEARFSGTDEVIQALDAMITIS